MRHGFGIHYFTDNGKSEGEFRNDKRNGKSCRYYYNGDKYEG